MRHCTRRRRRTESRGGFSLVELIAGIALTCLLGSTLLGLLVAQMRLTRGAAQRATNADAMRIAAAVLTGEVRRAARPDVRAVAAESLALRSFRGAGIVCGAGAGTVRVRYRGDRLPAAYKDSLLSVPRGSTASLVDVRVAPAGLCLAQPGEAVLELSTSTAVDNDAVLLVFESGIYFLTAHALRFRLGAGGRQPLTSESFTQAHTQFLTASHRSMGFVLAHSDGDVRVFSAAFGSR